MHIEALLCVKLKGDAEMKKSIRLFVGILLIVLCVSVCFTGCESKFVRTITPVGLCRYVQGGCTDGENLFVVMNDGKSGGKSSVIKYRLSDMKLLKTYKNLYFGHGNDVTYNSKTGQLIFTESSPNGRNLHIYDAQTMAFIKTVTLQKSVYAIAYDEAEDCYYAGISGTTGIIRLNSAFAVTAEYAGGGKGYTKQGLDIVDNYLCFLRYDENCVEIYTKDGIFVKEMSLPTDAFEPEFLCHLGDDYYVGYNLLTYTGGTIYRYRLDD